MQLVSAMPRPVAFLLLIACANVANLMLARAVSREKEIAIRVALGAGRGQIIRQLLIESSLLGLLGGLLGIMMAPLCVDALMWLVPDSLASGLASPDYRVFCFTFAVSILTALLFGLAPALQSARIDILSALKEGGRTSAHGSGRSRLRSGLVVAQVALALMLLAGTGLLVRSLMRMLGEDPGFQTSGVLTLQVTVPGGFERNFSPKTVLKYEEMVRQVEQLPGVQACGSVSFMPMTGNNSNADLQPEGYVPPPSGALPSADYHARETPWVASAYPLGTLGMIKLSSSSTARVMSGMGSFDVDWNAIISHSVPGSVTGKGNTLTTENAKKMPFSALSVVNLIY